MTPRIPVLYADEHLMVVDKPPGLLVVAAPGRRGPTLIDALRAEHDGEVFAVHRLDEETSGVLVVARTTQARGALEALFRTHAVDRRYVALLGRMPSPPAGRVESRLKVGDDGVVRSVDDRAATRAVTEYRAIERRGAFTLVECRLETGRRNQIRAHLAEIGCPIAGDRKYGYRARAGEARAGRVLLHAYRIRFVHPITGAAIDVCRDAPEVELRLPPGASDSPA